MTLGSKKSKVKMGGVGCCMKRLSTKGWIGTTEEAQQSVPVRTRHGYQKLKRMR